MDETRLPPNMILFILLCFLDGYVTVRASKDCYVALSECYEDKKCSLKLGDYAKECGTIVDVSNPLENTTRFPCSKSCVNSIKSLMQTKKGKVLWRCDCNLDERCLTLKSRTGKCLAIANGTYRKRTGCTRVLHKCTTNPRCNKAQTEFLMKCSKMFLLAECTRECLHSQKRLFSMAMGKPLMNCECDGVNEFHCHALRAYTNHMDCNWRKRRKERRRRRKDKQRKGDAPGKRKRREG